MNELTGWFKENRYLVAVIFFSVAVFAGQVVEAGAFSLDDIPDIFRAVIDPMQFMVGLLIISYIFVLISIRKYESFPNPMLNTIKWYFSIVMVNDFIILVFRVILKSNLISFTNSDSGTGMLYLMMDALRAVTDSTISSAALCLLIYGLSRYKLVDDDSPVSTNRLGWVIMAFVMVKWIFSIPVSMTGLVNNQTVFVLSLIVFLTAGMVTLALMYLMVSELRTRYKTVFLGSLTRYIGIGLTAAALNFIYSIGSYGLIQRFPAGEIQTLGWFGKLVLFITLMFQAVQNYYMFKALDGYSEGETVTPAENAVVETSQFTITE